MITAHTTATTKTSTAKKISVAVVMFAAVGTLGLAIFGLIISANA